MVGIIGSWVSIFDYLPPDTVDGTYGTDGTVPSSGTNGTVPKVPSKKSEKGGMK